MIRVFRICLIAGCAGEWSQVQLGAGSYLTITTAFSGEFYNHPASFKATAKGMDVNYPGAGLRASST